MYDPDNWDVEPYDFDVSHPVMEDDDDRSYEAMVALQEDEGDFYPGWTVDPDLDAEMEAYLWEYPRES